MRKTLIVVCALIGLYSQAQEFNNLKALDTLEVDDNIEWDYSEIEQTPLFSNCKQTEKEDQKKCFIKGIQENVKKNFNYPGKAVEYNIQGRVEVTFVIDKKGLVTNIKTAGPNIILENEARRITSKLPRLIPGIHKGKLVKVVYKYPIIFRLN